MSSTHRYKTRPQRTIITRSFNPNIDLLNKLTNSSEIPDSTESLQPIMAATSSSALNNNQNIEKMTGYGPDKKLHFFGVRDEFKSWQIRMKLRLRKLKLADILDAEEPDALKNLEVYMELVEHIDDKSLRLIQDVAEDNGKLAWKILSETYLGNDEDRIFKVLTDFSNLSNKHSENVIDYLCRIDEIKKILETNKIVLPDNLYIIMAMKGLAMEYDVLCDVIQTQKVKPTYEEFKSQVKAKEIRLTDVKISSAVKIMSVDESVNHVKSSTNNTAYNRPSFTKHERKCYNCSKYGHYGYECNSSKFCERCRKNGHIDEDCKSTRFCDHCKNYNHLTEDCWYKPLDSANTVAVHNRGAGTCAADDVDNTEVKKPDVNTEHLKIAPAEYYDLLRTKESCPEAYPDIVGVVGSGAHKKTSNTSWDGAVFKPPNVWHVRHQKQRIGKYLVDSGATHHIITDKSKFVFLDCNYDPMQHNLTLANGSTEFGKIKGKGVAYIIVRDEDGNPRRIMLSDALYVPSFTQNILSVMSLVDNGMELLMKKHEIKLRDKYTTYIAECESGLAYVNVEQ